jgi:hypothetical protein
MRHLKKIDSYILPKNIYLVSACFRKLDEVYFLSQDKEIERIKNLLSKFEFSPIAESLKKL